METWKKIQKHSNQEKQIDHQFTSRFEILMSVSDLVLESESANQKYRPFGVDQYQAISCYIFVLGDISNLGYIFVKALECIMKFC